MQSRHAPHLGCPPCDSPIASLSLPMRATCCEGTRMAPVRPCTPHHARPPFRRRLPPAHSHPLFLLLCFLARIDVGLSVPVPKSAPLKVLPKGLAPHPPPLPGNQERRATGVHSTKSSPRFDRLSWFAAGDGTPPQPQKPARAPATVRGTWYGGTSPHGGHAMPVRSSPPPRPE